MDDDTNGPGRLNSGGECSAISPSRKASKAEILQHLFLLQNCYRRQTNDEDTEAKFLLFVGDLEHVSEPSLREACKRYRCNPKHSFMATSGHLLGIIYEMENGPESETFTTDDGRILKKPKYDPLLLQYFGEKEQACACFEAWGAWGAWGDRYGEAKPNEPGCSLPGPVLARHGFAPHELYDQFVDAVRRSQNGGANGAATH